MKMNYHPSSIMKTIPAALVLALLPRVAHAALSCDLSQYKAGAGPAASLSGDVRSVSWRGDSNADLRARFAIANGQPVVRDF